MLDATSMLLGSSEAANELGTPLACAEETCEECGNPHSWDCSRNPSYCWACGFNVDLHGEPHLWNCWRNPEYCQECGYNLRQHGVTHAVHCSSARTGQLHVCAECGSRGSDHAWDCRSNPDYCWACGFNRTLHGRAHATNCWRQDEGVVDGCEPPGPVDVASGDRKSCVECGSAAAELSGQVHAWNCSQNPAYCWACGFNPAQQGRPHAWNCWLNPDFCPECGYNVLQHGEAHSAQCSRRPDVCEECGCLADEQGELGHSWSCSRHPGSCKACGRNVLRDGQVHAWNCSLNPVFCQEHVVNPSLHEGREHDRQRSHLADVCEECGLLRQLDGCQVHTLDCSRRLELCPECGSSPGSRRMGGGCRRCESTPVKEAFTAEADMDLLGQILREKTCQSTATTTIDMSPSRWEAAEILNEALDSSFVHVSVDEGTPSPELLSVGGSGSSSPEPGIDLDDATQRLPSKPSCPLCGQSEESGRRAHAWNCARNTMYCQECGFNPFQNEGQAHAWNCKRNLDFCQDCGYNPNHHCGQAHAWNCRHNADLCKECGFNPDMHGRPHEWNCKRNPDFCVECSFNPEKHQGQKHAWNCRRHPGFCNQCGFNPQIHGQAHAWNCWKNPEFCLECGFSFQQHGQAHKWNCRRNPLFCPECGFNKQTHNGKAHALHCSKFVGAPGGTAKSHRPQPEGSQPTASQRGRFFAATGSTALTPPPSLAKADSVEVVAEAEIRRIRMKLAGTGCARELKRSLRELQLKWHPDKNQGSEEVATKVFCYIQDEWQRNVI